MKTARILLATLALPFLGACMDPMTSGSESAPGTLAEVPEGVVALAAPNQDLTTVRVAEEDGCYWYRYSGPVETTYLPLRSKDGRPICARAQEPGAPQS